MSNLTSSKLLVPFSRLPRKKLVKNDGPQGRIDLIRKTVTDLVKKERIEVSDYVGYESRTYAERLIDLARKYGDRHVGTMEMADYWILEKDLIPKLFKVIVPRFHNGCGPYTQIFKLPIVYPGPGKRRIVMELKGNPYPPVVTESRDFSNSLTNILIKGLKNDKGFFRK